MFPFDRLIRAMDAWAAANPCEMLAQIGDGGYEPRNMPWVRRLERADYLGAVAGADLVVAHAGMGTVITAAEHGKPIVLLPRRGSLGEHNNDHQADTAVWLRTRPGIQVADGEADLARCIAAALAGRGMGGAAIGASAPPEFLARIRAFVQG
jgi:UDP-N-acetylglucosamine transferase subunit ALG13